MQVLTVEAFVKACYGLDKFEISKKACRKWGLVRESPSGDSWESAATVFKVPDNKGSKAIQAFDLPVNVRTFKSLLLPMSEEDFKVFNEMLNEFSKEQMARYNPKTFHGKRVYQANFNIFPVTRESAVQTLF